jgi:hypothetical protein
MPGRLIAFAWLALVSVAPAPASGQAAAGRTSFISYDEFTSLGDQAQLHRFAGLSAESKSHLVRTHAGRWLNAHRAELSASQIQVVEEAIAFLTPEFYADPGAATTVAHEASLKQRLACALGRDRAGQAFMVRRRHSAPAPAPESGVIARVLAWFSDCVVPR